MVKRLSVLSNYDIEKELGKNILIYPFSKSNLRGASYNLTASRLAWNLETGTTIFNGNKIIIAPSSTALIETNETIWVSEKITGSYHSKVKLVSKGLSHIGTTLDPLYLGNSLIAIHNHSNKPVEITELDSFVTLVLYYVASKSTIDPVGNNAPGRPDIYSSLQLTEFEKNWLDEGFRTNRDDLRKKMNESIDFNEIQTFRQIFGRKFKDWAIILIILVLWIASLSCVSYLESNEEQFKATNWYKFALNGAYSFMYGAPFGGVMTILNRNA